MKVAFIGLGVMGLPMAKHVYNAGYLYKVYNRTRSKAEFFQNKGVHVANSPQEASDGADLVITMVSDSSDAEEVILGEEGIIHTVRRGAIVVDMSSINPEVSKQIGFQLNAEGVSLLDAPVSGGEQGAIEGKLAIMAGGEKDIVKKSADVLRTMGSFVHMGPLGAGGYAKLANQIIVGINIQAISEAFYLAEKAHLDFETLYTGIKHGLAGSRVLDQKITNLKEEVFTPGFKVDLHLKDINNALSAAESLEADLPFTRKIKAVMQEMCKEGMNNLDHSSLYAYLKKTDKSD